MTPDYYIGVVMSYTAPLAFVGVLVWMAVERREVTIGDVLMAALFAMFWPVFVLIWIVTSIEDFTVWRRK